MKRILVIVLGLIIIVLGVVFVGRALTIKNTFDLKVESDTDVHIYRDGVYKRTVLETYKKGLRRMATTSGSINPTFYKVSSNGKVSEVSSNKYVLKKEVKFRTTNDYGDIEVEMSLDSTNSKELNNTLRVMIVIDGRFYIFAPGEEPNQSYKGTVGKNSDGTAVLSEEFETLSKFHKTNIVTGFTMLEEFTMTIYVWYEANDGSVTNYRAKGKNTNSLVITLC